MLITSYLIDECSFQHVFGISSSCLLSYLKIRNFEGVKNHNPSIHPPIHPSTHPSTHPHYKTFLYFSFRGEIGISSTLAGTNSIKYKILKWTPSGSAFADSLRGIKHFGIFVSSAQIRISSTLLRTDWIKHKMLKWTPSGPASAGSLRGIKHFQNFKKADKVCVFET